MSKATLTGPIASVRRMPWSQRDAATPVDEHALYPIHEEDNVPEKPLHEYQVRYLIDALAVYLPDKWVTGDICMYWEERNFHQYAAPDVLVVDCEPPDPMPDVHLRWADPPALFVAEVGSKSTFRRDEGPKLEIYGLDLKVPEYLYFHPTRNQLTLYRLGESGYESVSPDARGWVFSQELNLWFGRDEKGFLRIYTPTGEMLLSHEEEARARCEAEARAAAAEQRLAEMEAELQRIRAPQS